jgi:hypothetical protein
VLTDPQINTAEPTHDFGIGNMGPQGISSFFKGHRCGEVCEALHLHNPCSTIDQAIVDDKFRSQQANLRKIWTKVLGSIVALWAAYTTIQAVFYLNPAAKHHEL